MLVSALQFILCHKRFAWLVAFLAVLCGGLAMYRGHYGTRIDGIFPEGSESANAMALLAESGLSNRLLIDCDFSHCSGKIDNPNRFYLAELDHAVERLSALPGVREVRFRTLPENLEDNLEALLPAIPQLLPPPEVTPELADDIARNTLKQLMMPAPGASAILRNDPFGLRNQLLLRLQALRQTTELKFDDTKPFLCSQDGTHALIVLELDFPYSDSVATRQLISQIQEILTSPQTLDAGRQTTDDEPLTSDLSPMTFHLVGAHLHTIGNEDTIRRDLAIIGILSPIFLLALFLKVFRGDWRCIWIPLIPAAATVVVAGLMTMVVNTLQLFVLGLGGSILGLAVDQGIHVYIACREENPEHRLARLAKPLALGAGTSIAVFLLLLFTRSPALQQLGVLAGGALSLSLLTSFFLLPTLLKRGVPLCATDKIRTQDTPIQTSRPRGRGVIFAPIKLPASIIVILTILATALSFVPKMTTSFRVEALDGIPEKVRLDEYDYQTAWQPAQPNLLLLRDPDGSQTPRLHVALAKYRPVSPQTFWPDESTRAENLAAWRNAPLDTWEELLDSAAVARGLPKGFFQPFFDKTRQNLTTPTAEPPGWLAQAYHQLRRNGISNFFLAEPPESPEALSACTASFDAAYLAPEALRAILTHGFGPQLSWLLGTAIVIILLLTWLTFRSVKKLLLALLPVLLTLRWLTAIFAYFDHPITLMTAIGGVLLVGLAIDYGVFAVQRLDEGSGSTIPQAMRLSALTTVFTTGILLFSDHPVLFDLGLVLSLGITLAYLIAKHIVPAVAQFTTPKTILQLLLIVGVFLLASCRTAYPARPDLDTETAYAELLEQAQTAPPTTIRAKVTAHFLWHAIPFLTVGQLDHSAHEVHLAGLATTGGAKLFEITATPNEIRDAEISPLAPKVAQRAFERIAMDLARAFLDNEPVPPESLYPDRRGVVRFTANDLQYIYAGKPLVLFRKASVKPRWAWRRQPDTPDLWLFVDPNAHLQLEVRFLE
jgi:predicted RND superfamily exporter protein